MEVRMLRKILGLLILGLVLASCGTTPVAGGLKDVTATSADSGVSLKWVFDGDKSTIKGFRIYRNAGGDSSSYTKLTDVLSVNATSYSDTVAQGQTYKYGVAVIKSDNSEGTRVYHSGDAVGPKPVTSTGNMDGNWTMDATITEVPDGGNPAEIGRVFPFILDITETSGVLTGTLDFRIKDSNPPAPDPDLSFGEQKIEGTKNTSGSYTFKMIEAFDDPATDGSEEKSWTITTTSVTATGFTGTYTNVFGFKGTVVGTKIP
jgi:hypothetical protein